MFHRRCYIYLMIASSSLRLLFWILFPESLYRLSTVQILQSLGYGVIFDSLVISCATCVFLLIDLLSSTAGVINKNERSRKIGYALKSLISISILFLATADIPYFYLTQKRISLWMIHDNVDQLGPILATTFASPHLYWSIFGLFLPLIWGYSRFTRNTQHMTNPNFLFFLKEFLFFFAVSFVYWPDPLWRTSTIASLGAQGRVLSHNTIYEVTSSYVAEARKGLRNLPSLERPIPESVFKRIYERDQKAQDAPEDLEVLSTKPNIMFLLMEYMGAPWIQHFSGSQQNETPFLNALAKESLIFENIFAASTRTIHGLVSTSAGFPAVLDMSVVRAYKSGTIPTIASDLKGYNSYFACGVRATYDHMDIFLRQGGFQTILDPDSFFQFHYQQFSPPGTWGHFDHEVFHFLNRYNEDLHNQGKPFLGLALTTTNHEPFDVPEHFLKSRPDLPPKSLEAGIAYADWALEQFFTEAKTLKYFQKTVFVLIADHSRSMPLAGFEMKKFHIPFMIYAPGLNLKPKNIQTIGGQIDVLPTLKGLLGIPQSKAFGRDLRTLPNDPSSGFACSRDGDLLYFRRDNYLLEFHVKTEQSRLFKVGEFNVIDAELAEDAHTPSLKEDLTLQAKAFLQTAIKSLQTGTPPPRDL